MKYILLLTFCVCLFPEFDLLWKLNGKTDCFSSDSFGNMYVSENGGVSKIDVTGKITDNYSNSFLGNVCSVDATDPLRILAFYKDFSQVLFLDNHLAEIGSPVLLDDLGLYSATAVCSSSDAGFWVYDSQKDQLFYINNKLEKIHSSLKLSFIIETKALPSYLTEKNGQVYLYFPDNGLIIFDKYGNNLRKIPVINADYVQVSNSRFYYLKDEGIYCVNLETLEENELKFSGSGIKMFSVEKNLLFVIQDNERFVYKLSTNF